MKGVIWKHDATGPQRGEVLLRGQIIGHVIRRARVAAGTAGAKVDRGTLAAGTRKHFYTALPAQPATILQGLVGNGSSIGTRFATGADAVRALVLWHTEFCQGAWWQYDGPAWRAERKRSWGF